MARPKKRKREQQRRLHREPIVREIARLLDAGTPTKFRWESACRRGVRAAMCLKGWKWEMADDYAARVVTLALHRIGSGHRPTWNMGQPQTEEREYFICQGCGGFMDGGSRHPWCGDECSSRLYARRHLSRRDDMARDRALRVALTGGAEIVHAPAPERLCRHCGEPFRLHPNHLRQKHCSISCAQRAALRRLELRDCIVCAEQFKPVSNNQKACTLRCQKVARVRGQRSPPREQAQCGQCREWFDLGAAGPVAKYCGNLCRSRAKRAARERDRAASAIATPGDDTVELKKAA